MVVKRAPPATASQRQRSKMRDGRAARGGFVLHFRPCRSQCLASRRRRRPTCVAGGDLSQRRPTTKAFESQEQLAARARANRRETHQVGAHSCAKMKKLTQSALSPMNELGYASIHKLERSIHLRHRHRPDKPNRNASRDGRHSTSSVTASRLFGSISFRCSAEASCKRGALEFRAVSGKRTV